MDTITPSSPLKGEALITQIRKGVERHGYELVRPNGTIVEDADLPDRLHFVMVLGTALLRAKGEAGKTHVMQLLTGIAANAAVRSGPVQVRLAAWLLLLSYADTGAVPEKTEQVTAPRPGVKGQRVFP